MVGVIDLPTNTIHENVAIPPFAPKARQGGSEDANSRHDCKNQNKAALTLTSSLLVFYWVIPVPFPLSNTLLQR